MEALIGQWLSNHGVSATLVVFLIALWVQLRPKVFALLEAWADQLDNQTMHDLLIGLVRAAEQTFGADQNAAKLDYVKTEAQKIGLLPAVVDIEAAVHEVKAPAKVWRDMLAGEICDAADDMLGPVKL